MGKNKFIDKKKSATYQILARDTSDPNYSPGLTGDRVFVRVDSNPYQVRGFSDEEEPVNDDDASVDDPNSIFADAPGDYDSDDAGHGFPGNRNRTGTGTGTGLSLPDHVRKEILELGFPDDGYNYLDHLREIKNSGGGSVYYQNPKAKFDHLPPDVKAYNASKVEISRVNDDSNEMPIYDVASKTLNAKIEKVDDEIAALLDDSDLSRFGSDIGDLEEDFVVKANLREGGFDMGLDENLRLLEKPEINRTERNDLVVSGVHETVAIPTILKDEKPRVLRPLDEQFDMLELQEYGTESEDADEYGGYDGEEDEIRESLAEKLTHALKDHGLKGADNKFIGRSGQDKMEMEDVESPESAADVIQRCKEYAKNYENESEDEKEVVVVLESSDESEVWDCETIVSTYSNLDNHPGKIEAPVTRKKKLSESFSGSLSSPGNVIALKGKEKLPVDFLPHPKKSSREKVKDGGHSSKPETPKRKQHGQESKEEKKERKASVKEERREARKMKKEMKGLYKDEAQRAQRVVAVTGPSSIHIM